MGYTQGPERPKGGPAKVDSCTSSQREALLRHGREWGGRGTKRQRVEECLDGGNEKRSERRRVVKAYMVGPSTSRDEGGHAVVCHFGNLGRKGYGLMAVVPRRM